MSPQLSNSEALVNQGCFFFSNKIQLFDFTNKESGPRCWGKGLLGQRQRKHSAKLRPQQLSQNELSLSHGLRKPPSNGMSLPSTSRASLSVRPPKSFVLSMVFFLIILCSLPLNWLLAPSFDL